MFAAMAPLLSIFAATCSKSPFLGLLVPWYRYLDLDPNDGCRITSFDGPDGLLRHGADSPVLLIGLAILEDLIRIAALVAVGYVLYGGFQYLTSQGAPDVTKKAQQTIIYALVGVVVAVIAAGAVAFLGATLAGGALVGPGGLPNPNADNFIPTILSLVFKLAAAIAALMIVVGGFRYILAHGDSNAVAQARRTILYAVIGLVVIMAAYGIVTFVVRWIL